MISPMTRLAFHDQSAVARGHGVILVAINASQPQVPVSIHWEPGSAVPDFLENLVHRCGANGRTDTHALTSPPTPDGR